MTMSKRACLGGKRSTRVSKEHIGNMCAFVRELVWQCRLASAQKNQAPCCRKVPCLYSSFWDAWPNPICSIEQTVLRGMARDEVPLLQIKGQFMPKGFDTTIGCGGKASQIKSAGYDFVGRYLSSHHWKVITPAEADELTTAGLSIVLVYEDNPTAPTYFSFGQGESDATRAAQQASSLGAPDNTTIYFAVDYDASEHDLAGPIAEYFQGVATGLRNFAADNNPQYRIGVYGSGATCLAMIGTGLTSQGWLAQARRWRGHDKFTDFVINQSLPSHVLGLSVDPDLAIGDFGAMPAAQSATLADLRSLRM